MNTLQLSDYIVFFIYFIVVASYGYYIYKKKQRKEASSADYFLAEGSLTWWAIGASLIASNISAEHFVGMSGSGFKMGLAIATYEWLAAATLIVVAVFFLPVYLKNKIYTMPQFLKTRYNGTVAMIMAIFWLLLYVLVNLTSILYLGALAINSISGISITTCMYFLAVFAIFITLGGMKVIGYTDVIQVAVLIIGGLVTTYLALSLVADHFQQPGVLNGFALIKAKADDHFHMIFQQGNTNYNDLPGLTVVLGGMWIVHMNYWGCNQYIIQRALGADLKTAREGILFAAFLKILMPLIVVIPGIAAFVLYQEGYSNFTTDMLQDGTTNPDKAYPVLLNLLPVGLKGLSFAALTAAIVASLAGKANSISTIFTLDIFKNHINKQASEKSLVFIGRATVVVAMILAVIIAPFLGIDKKGGFAYIQEYTGFVSPGIFAMFILGFFWKKATSNAALFATIGGFTLSVVLKFLPAWLDLSALQHSGWYHMNGEGVYEIPFLDRMGIVFVCCVLGMYVISQIEHKKRSNEHALEVDTSMFKPNKGFVVGAMLVLGILVALYTLFW